MTHDVPSPAVLIDRTAFHRKLLIWTHCVLVSVVTIIRLGTLDYNARSHYWVRGAGIAVMIAVTPAWAPYLISAIHAVKVAPAARLRVGAFLAVLVAGATVQVAIFLNLIQLEPGQSAALYMLFGLSTVYYFAAEFLMNVIE